MPSTGNGTFPIRLLSIRSEQTSFTHPTTLPSKGNCTTRLPDCEPLSARTEGYCAVKAREFYPTRNITLPHFICRIVPQSSIAYCENVNILLSNQHNVSRIASRNNASDKRNTINVLPNGYYGSGKIWMGKVSNKWLSSLHSKIQKFNIKIILARKV